MSNSCYSARLVRARIISAIRHLKKTFFSTKLENIIVVLTCSESMRLFSVLRERIISPRLFCRKTAREREEKRRKKMEKIEKFADDLQREFPENQTLQEAMNRGVNSIGRFLDDKRHFTMSSKQILSFFAKGEERKVQNEAEKAERVNKLYSEWEKIIQIDSQRVKLDKFLRRTPRVFCYYSYQRDINGVVGEMVDKANTLNMQVRCDFNGYCLVVQPGETPEEIISKYFNEYVLISGFSAAWKNAIECAVEKDGKTIVGCAAECAHSIVSPYGETIGQVFSAYSLIVRSDWKYAKELEEWGRTSDDFISPFFKQQ